MNTPTQKNMQNTHPQLSSRPNTRIRVHAIAIPDAWLEGSVDAQALRQSVVGFMAPQRLNQAVMMTACKPLLTAFEAAVHPQIEPLGHLRCVALARDELYENKGACLCCTLNTPLADALRQLFMAVLTKKQPKVTDVYVVTQAHDEAVLSQSLKQTLRHAPFLGQRYQFGQYFCGNTAPSS